MKKVTIYTDGACSGNPGPGGWGAILMYKDQKKEISGYFPDTTNNRIIAISNHIKEYLIEIVPFLTSLKIMISHKIENTINEIIKVLLIFFFLS